MFHSGEEIYANDDVSFLKIVIRTNQLVKKVCTSILIKIIIMKGTSRRIRTQNKNIEKNSRLKNTSRQHFY